MAFGLIPLVLLVVVVVAVVTLVRRNAGPGRSSATGDGGDVLAYLLMAIAVGVSVFSVARLARAAFPGGVFIFDPEREVAAALAGIVVSAPFTVFLWNRQRKRRALHPHSAGWTLYLSLIEAVFMTVFVIALFQFLDWLFSSGRAMAWTDLVAYGAVVVLHEMAVRATPPGPDAGELPRVIGTVIGLVPLMIGLGGFIYWGLAELYGTLATQPSDGISLGTSLAFLLTGLPVWWYRWIRKWRDDAGPARWSFTFLATAGSLSVAIGSTVVVVAQTMIYLLTSTRPAGQHFGFLPAALTVALVAVIVWAHHRRMLGRERDDPVRAYEYLSTAFGLSAAIGGATTLITAVLSPSPFVGNSDDLAIVGATIVVFGLAVWYRFWSRAQAMPRGIEAASTPRRFYLLGLGVVTGLIGAGALITALVFVFQALLGVDTLSTGFVAALGLTISAGAAAAHLFRTYAADRELTRDRSTVTPFDVTVITSHPGALAARFPKQARLRVVYRDDDNGPVDDEMADRIVEAVAGRSSIVWVDETGFRVAPAR